MKKKKNKREKEKDIFVPVDFCLRTSFGFPVGERVSVVGPRRTFRKRCEYRSSEILKLKREILPLALVPGSSRSCSFYVQRMGVQDVKVEKSSTIVKENKKSGERKKKREEKDRVA